MLKKNRNKDMAAGRSGTVGYSTLIHQIDSAPFRTQTLILQAREAPDGYFHRAPCRAGAARNKRKLPEGFYSGRGSGELER